MVQSRAAAAQAGAPLSIETINVDGPRAGEVMVQMKATGLCHTDAFTLSGADPEGIFPASLGTKAAWSLTLGRVSQALRLAITLFLYARVSQCANIA